MTNIVQPSISIQKKKKKKKIREIMKIFIKLILMMRKKFDKDNPETIIHLAWHKFKKCKALKKDISKELIPGV